MTTYARRLGLFSGTMAVVGGIIGGGIFRTPATVAERLHSTSLVLLAWVIGGIVALIGAFCFGELGARRPRAGGGYVYLRETFGPLPAFLYGWALLLVITSGACAAVAKTFAGYVLNLTGLPEHFTVPIAVGAIVLLAGINYVGVKPASVTQNIFTLLKLVALTALIVAGLTLSVPVRPCGFRRNPRDIGSCPRPDPVYVRRLATDQFHRRGDHRAGAQSAARAGAGRGGRGDGLSARQPRVPARPRGRRSGPQR